MYAAAMFPSQFPMTQKEPGYDPHILTLIYFVTRETQTSL